MSDGQHIPRAPRRCEREARRRRSLLVALAAAAAFFACTATASAALHSLTLTLADGQEITVHVDVPDGTPPEQVQVPGVPQRIVAIRDNGARRRLDAAPDLHAARAQAHAARPPPPRRRRPRPPRRRAGRRRATGAARSGRRGGRVPRASGRARTSCGGRTEARRTPARPEATPDAAPARVRTRPPIRTPAAPHPRGTLRPGPVGVPNFFIRRFRIPPFLLPIYQAAGVEYGVRWEVLAAINEVETDYGRNLNVSSAGATGWMQFMPASWRTYGVDGNQDGVKDPYNPVDAIFAAARYLRAAGAERDVRRAVFAYNHADWYVDMVMARARVIGALPANLIGSLTGLTQGRFPVNARATYAGQASRRNARERVARGENAARPVESRAGRRGTRIVSRRGAAVVAATDGRVVRIGETERLGRYVQVQDVYGNTYTYGHLAKVERTYAVPEPERVSGREIRRELELPAPDAAPGAPASATDRPASRRPAPAASGAASEPTSEDPAQRAASEPAPAGARKARIFANPTRPRARRAGGAEQLAGHARRLAGVGRPADTSSAYLRRLFGEDARLRLERLRPGARVPAGTILGRLGKTVPTGTAHLLFEVRPAGRGAPRIDPTPVLDGWRLLESTDLYRAGGRNPFSGDGADVPSVGQVLLMSKETLARRVLANPRIEIYACGRRDVATGQVDRRVLATLEYLAASGLRPTVSSLKCGHSRLTSSGNVSDHSSGNAVDIAAINGVPILGHQGPGSVTELAIQRVLTLQGTLEPHQVISLMTFDGARNTLAMEDHDDHIHVGWDPQFGTNAKTARQVDAILAPRQWSRLIDRLDAIENPTVRSRPSKDAIGSGG